jgi:hypothetical protein
MIKSSSDHIIINNLQLIYMPHLISLVYLVKYLSHPVFERLEVCLVPVLLEVLYEICQVSPVHLKYIAHCLIILGH